LSVVRSSELSWATNEKTQAVGLGFLLAGAELPRFRAADRFWGADYETKPATPSRCFFIGTPRSSELGSATNEKTQAVGPGFGFLVAGAGLEPTAFGL
jgi:hypothetical protein